MKEHKSAAKEWRDLLNDQLLKDRANQVFESYEIVIATQEFKSFLSLLGKRGQNIFQDAGHTVKLLQSSDFNSVDQRVGLALFANICFGKPMGLDGTSIADNPKGQLRFLEIDGKIVSFVGEKIIDDDFNRRIYYLDIAGTLGVASGKGFGPILGKISLEDEIKKSKKDIIFLSRTQNPMLVGMARKILPQGVLLAPFWSNPNPELVQSANWMVEKGYMARNNTRPDAHFNAVESMISWNSYGRKGDGTTWEDMTKQIKNLDWHTKVGTQMQKYLVDHGTSWDEAMIKGHSFVIGAFIKKQFS